MGRREDDERLVRNWHAYAYRYAFFLTGDRERAADLAQDALVRALSKRPDDLADQAFGSWLRTVMVRLEMDGRRRLGRELVALKRLAGFGGRNTDAPEEPSPLMEALNRLTAKQRACVVLRYVEDLSEEQVACALGLRLGTVKAHLARARATLRGQLETPEAASEMLGLYPA